MSATMASSRPVGSVFWPVVGRFAWKEIRATRGLALGAAGILCALLTFVSTILWSDGQSITPRDSEVFFIMAGTVSALYAVAASITAFAAERELRTHTFLFQMPHYWVAMGLGKLLAIVTAALVVAVVLGSMAIAFAGGVVPDDLGMLAGNQVLFLVEAIAWSLLISLVCPQPLVGAVIACAMLSIGPYFVTGYVVTNQYIQLPELYEAAPHRVVVAMVLMAINVALVRWWIEQVPEQGSARGGIFGRRRDTVVVQDRRGPVGSQTRRHSLAGLRLLDLSPYAWRTSLVRLIWHAWRVGWGRMLGIVIALGAFVAVLYLVAPVTVVLPIAMGGVLLPALLGSVVFGGDQREGRYEFLAQHGASPGRVWLSRVLVWLVPVMLVLAMLALTAWPELREDIQEHYHWSYLLTGMFMTALTAFALGQLASLWVKSEIRAAGLAVAFMVLLVLWSPIAGYWRISPWWSLLPIALGALVAARIDIRAWMNNRRDSVSWGKSVAAAVVPIAIVVGTVPLVRDWQIEWALRQVPAEHVRALHQQREELQSRRETGARVTARYEALARLSGEGWFTGDEAAELRELTKESLFRTMQLLGVETAQILARELRLQVQNAETVELAWENYLALYRFRGQLLQEGGWGIEYRVNSVIDPELEKATFDFALRRGQTAERLEAAIDDLRAADAAYPPLDRGIMWEYMRVHDALDGRGVGESRPLSTLHFLPGEESRARKALDVVAAIERDYIDRVYTHHPPSLYVETNQYVRPEHLPAWRLAQSSPAVESWWPGLFSFVDRTANAKDAEARRGLEKIRLALMAHHLRHGVYPEFLGDLPMEIATLLPSHWPVLEKMVEYAPSGYALPVEVREGDSSTRRGFEPHTPLLWIGGSYAQMEKLRVREHPADAIPLVEEDGMSADEAQASTVDVLVIGPASYPSGAHFTRVAIPLPRSEDYPTHEAD